MSVVRRLSRNVSESLSPGKSDLLPRYAPETHTRAWSSTSKLSLAAFSAICLFAFGHTGTGRVTKPATESQPALDPLVSRALQTERTAAEEVHFIQTNTDDPGEVAPTSPLPMAPMVPPYRDQPSWEAEAVSTADLEQRDAATAAERVEAQLEAAASDATKPDEALPLDGILQAALEAKAMAAAKADAHERMREAMEKAKAAAADRVRRSAAGAKQLGAAQGKASNVISFLSDGRSSRGEGCMDRHSSCKHWARAGECSNNQAYMHRSCADSCGVCERRQVPAEGPTPDAAATEPASDGKPAEAGEAGEWKCADEHPRCAQWAVVGECERNPDFMRSDCPISCSTCETAERMARLRIAAGLPA